MAETRDCAQCGTPFTPAREHARFCTAHCRMAWNREHVGIAAAPAVAIGWSVTAMTESAARVNSTQTWELLRLAAAVAETVWWVTLVDATLVRYHLRAYEKALASSSVRRRRTEETLEGLRYVRNELGRSTDAAVLIDQAADANGAATWTWQSLPEPELGTRAARARRWELNRYNSYQARLAGHSIIKSFTRSTSFLEMAANLAGTAQ